MGKKFCIDCNKPKSDFGIRCLRCANLLRWKNPEYRDHMSKIHMGYKQSKETIEKRIKSTDGKQRFKLKGIIPWNKGLQYAKISQNNEDDYKMRRLFRVRLQKQIFERDNYQCQLCGLGGDLQVDHIQSWKDYVKLRFNMDNCRTLCAKCHYKITFGKPMPKNIKGWGHNMLRREQE